MVEEKEVSAKIVESEPMAPKTTECAAKEIVTSYMYGSIAAGFVPMPLVDAALITAINVKMVHSLSNVYGIKFSKDICKTIIASLIGGSSAVALTHGGLRSLVKVIPFVGNIISYAVMPASAAATTYAVGKVFIQHFEAGGTFLSFNPEKVKVYFAQQFEEGKLKIKKEAKA